MIYLRPTGDDRQILLRKSYNEQDIILWLENNRISGKVAYNKENSDMYVIVERRNDIEKVQYTWGNIFSNS
jgi:hypothetical protein